MLYLQHKAVILNEQTISDAELEKMSRRESEQRLQNEIVYLQQQMAKLSPNEYYRYLTTGVYPV